MSIDKPLSLIHVYNKKYSFWLTFFLLSQDEGEATFQLALISDGVTSYALVYYKVGAMTWTYRGRWSYVIMGVSDGSRDNYQRNLYTKTKRAYMIDSVSGNTGNDRECLGSQGMGTGRNKLIACSLLLKDRVLRLTCILYYQP